jgi:starch synthase
MDILHVSTELSPYAKVGGLADVAAALTKHLRLLGHRVTLALPRYRSLDQSGLLLGRRLTPLSFELGGKKLEAIVYDSRLASGVDLVAIDIPGMFDRPGVYGQNGEDFPDNPERFAAFSKAVVELVSQRADAGSPFAVVHAHDWPTALVPYFIKRHARHKPATVLTMHNIAHQGIVSRERIPSLGVAWEDFHMEGVEFFGQANLLKAGIVSAGALTTVSETYARDILTQEHGGRLEGVLRARAGELTGIVNGVDSSVWNPATDVALAARYDVEDITNKARCKGALLAELGLELTAGRALAVFVGRLVGQKGADLLLSALPKLLGSEMAVAVAGDGDEAIIKKLQAATEKYPGRVAFVRGAGEPLVHRMFAGADLVLVPSRFEPCGLVQLYAQRYGALPVAHAVGGIRDTVVDCDSALETGTGFLFDEPTAAALVAATQRARAAYDSPRWRGLVRRVMRLDRGWERPARRYEQIYRALTVLPPCLDHGPSHHRLARAGPAQAPRGRPARRGAPPARRGRRAAPRAPRLARRARRPPRGEAGRSVVGRRRAPGRPRRGRRPEHRGDGHARDARGDRARSAGGRRALPGQAARSPWPHDAAPERADREPGRVLGRG